MLQFDVTPRPPLPAGQLALLPAGRAHRGPPAAGGRQRPGGGVHTAGWTCPGPMTGRRSSGSSRPPGSSGGQSQALVVIGIGGSYLGAPGPAGSASPPPNYNLLCGTSPQVFFTGNNLSLRQPLTELLDYLRDKDFFRKRRLQVRHHHGARHRLSPLPAAAGGEVRPGGGPGPDLRHHRPGGGHPSAPLANQEGYATFSIPRDIGGAGTPCSPRRGLLPLAVAGVDIRGILDGAPLGHDRPAPAGAGEPRLAIRRGPERPLCPGEEHRALGRVRTPPAGLRGVVEAAVRGERGEGRPGGSSPPAWSSPPTCTPWASTSRRGARDLFETVVRFTVPQSLLPAGPPSGGTPSGLGYLRGRDLRFVNEQAPPGHRPGPRRRRGAQPAAPPPGSAPPSGPGSWCISSSTPAACRGTCPGVNPFNQPGVEAYKANMFALLGKARLGGAPPGAAGRPGPQGVRKAHKKSPPPPLEKF